MFSEALLLIPGIIMATLSPKELVSLLKIMEEDIVEKNSLEK